MGFTGFGDGKKAKHFDMAKIMEDAKQKAKDRNAANNAKLERDYNHQLNSSDGGSSSASTSGTTTETTIPGVTTKVVIK